jgi:hypothetical protein
MSLKVRSLGAVAGAAEGITCSGSTNATPIVLTIAPSTTHRLKPEDRVGVSGITGNTGANGDWDIAAVAATTATLRGSVGNGTHGGSPLIRPLMDETPFLPGHSVLALITSASLSATILVERCDTMTTDDFVDAKVGGLALGADVGSMGFEVVLGRYMRLVASAHASGSARADLVS